MTLLSSSMRLAYHSLHHVARCQWRVRVLEMLSVPSRHPEGTSTLEMNPLELHCKHLRQDHYLCLMCLRYHHSDGHPTWTTVPKWNDGKDNHPGGTVVVAAFGYDIGKSMLLKAFLY